MCVCKMPFSDTYLNILDLCRLCLVKDSILTPVIDSSLNGHLLSDKINTCLAVQIKTEDRVSQKICNECLTKVNSFYEFRINTSETQKILQRWLSEGSEKLLNSKITEDIETPRKDTDGEVKEELKSEQTTSEETDESENDCESGSDCESSNSEESDGSGTSREEKTLDSNNQTITSNSVSIESEIPGPSGIQLDSPQFPSKKLLENRGQADGQKSVANKTLNTCEFCGLSFTRFKLEIHKRKHTGERPFKCSEPGCDWAFASKGMLSSHKKVHCNDRPFVCNHCTSSFKTAKHLNNHIMIHTGEKPYCCDLCDYSCIYKATLLIHRKRHLNQYSIICEICGKGFYSRSDLKDHLSGHTGETPLSCDKCTKKFSTKYYLLKHKTTVHKVITDTPIPIQCEKCSRVCPDNRSYKTHMRRVHANKKYECDICGKIIGNKSYLSEHMRIHSGEKPYSCKLCGKSFAGKKGMRMHEVVHTGVKKYECDKCGNKFTQKSSLNAHKKLHISKSYI